MPVKTEAPKDNRSLLVCLNAFQAVFSGSTFGRKKLSSESPVVL